jgi:hypothetical protein
MRDKIKVRLKPGSPVANRLGVSPDQIGAVLCRYRILRAGEQYPERVDVRFDERCVAWGIPEKEVEILRLVEGS